MVKLTMLARVTDGLPLAEGLDDGRDMQDAELYKQQVKALFKNLARGQNEPSRMSIETGPYIFHYIIEARVCYLTMCDRAYPKKLAFQYLEDLKNEFERVNGSQIETAARPYAFIKFDTFIQKTKKLYQDTRTQRNISKLNDELYEVHQIMTRNVQEVLGVGEKLDQVSQMSSRLTSESRIYADKAKDLNRQNIMNRGRGRSRDSDQNVGGNSGGSDSHRGRSSRPRGYSANRQPHSKAGWSSFDTPLGGKEGFSENEEKQNIGDFSMRTPMHLLNSGSNSAENHNCSSPDISSGIGKINLVQNSPNSVGYSPKQVECLSASRSGLSAHSDPTHKQPNAWRTPGSQTSHSGAASCSTIGVGCSPVAVKQEFQPGENSHEKTSGTRTSEKSESSPCGAPYDICPVKTGTTIMLKASLLVKNREKRNEVRRLQESQNIIVLRPGMVLLKGFIACDNQVKIAKRCRYLGLDSGGFYQPGYRDGAKLNLKMMCLGKNWDPETSGYGDQRPIDGAKPPGIPSEFHELVMEAIQDSRAFLKKEHQMQNVDRVLPSMQPNICIVNFYTNSGKLGLHQDKDESEESLRKGLPVVSFSIGDSAEFLYGDTRDIEKAEKVVLESGDVLIFGGKSRHVFHGVTAIFPNTAPKALLEASNLRAGRLNLTFREY